MICHKCLKNLFDRWLSGMIVLDPRVACGLSDGLAGI